MTKFIGPLCKSNRKSTKKVPQETLDAKKKNIRTHKTVSCNIRRVGMIKTTNHYDDSGLKWNTNMVFQLCKTKEKQNGRWY